MATIYRVYTVDRTGLQRFCSFDDIGDAHLHILACHALRYPVAVCDLVGHDWWNDPPHPRLQRVVDSLDRIHSQEYKG